MSEVDEPLNDPAFLRRALLARARFEQGMGVETLRPAPLARAAHSVPAAAAPVATAPEKAPAVAEAPPAAADKETRWRVLEAAALACTKCPLHKGRQHVVFGQGNRNAKLVFVGEGPGADEDRQGLPFVGRAGQLLNKILGAMNWKREDVYICNVVKCRPPENRTPLPDEIAACNPYLREQLELISPKVIVTLGAPATKTLLNTTQGIMSARGKWFSYRGIPVMPTFHPAFLLRSYTEENRRAVWEDMKKVAEKLKE